MSGLPAALTELCALEGIELAYHDIWGHRHEAPEATLRAFLTEMGIEASAPEAVEQALAQRRARQAMRALEPCCVVRALAQDQGVRVRPGALPSGPLRWRLCEEHGGRHEGPFERQALEPAGEGEALWRLPAPIPAGYHRLELLSGSEPVATSLLIAAPERCWQPERLRAGARVFGPAVQLYAVRSARNWGIGDFTDLMSLLEQWAERGADFVGLNPLHAMFPHDPEHASPYSPCSRLFLNVLYIDVERVPECRDNEAIRERIAAPAFQGRLATLRAAGLVDYAAVSALKLSVLREAWVHFQAVHLGGSGERAQAFEAFRQARGPALRQHATFEALAARFHAADAGQWRWQHWPPAWRDPNSPEVQAFAREQAEAVGFFEYLQWQAAEQLEAVARRAEALGLAVGLYLDLALAPDRGGSEVWTHHGLFAENAGSGAPPDDFNALGQDWGLPPVVPEQLVESGFEHFVQVLRAAMAPAGALRIDHVMSLMRLFWVPPGGRPAEGAYVRYPFETLLAIVALESQRNGCLVVGEDLGTVPPEVREALARSDVLSYRLLYFEKDHQGHFRLPGEYPRQALVAATTHDLPPLGGYWQGRDLDLRESLGLFRDQAMRERLRWERGEDRGRLVAVLEREGLLAHGSGSELLHRPDLDERLLLAVHAWLARTPCLMLAVQLEDLEGAVEAVNVPGTTNEHPNWRRRLSVPLETWPGESRFLGLTAALAQARPREG